MFRVTARGAAAAARVVSRSTISAVREASAASQAVVAPTVEELERTRVFLNLMDDRLADRLREVNGGILRLERRMDKMEARMDTFATKEFVKEGFQHVETRLKYYLLAGVVSIISVLATRYAVTFFMSPERAQDVRLRGLSPADDAAASATPPPSPR